MRVVWIVPAAFMAVLATAVVGRSAAPTAPPVSVQSLLACRSIPDSTQRLACYDRETGNVAQAISKNDLVVIDKAQAAQAKRSLFGFSVPNFAGLLGGGDVTQVEGIVQAAQQDGEGNWMVQLSDGSVWQQTDGTPVALEPRHGDKVIVKRGTLGSYFFKLGNQPGFKAKRIG